MWQAKWSGFVSSSALAPALADANDSKGNDGANDEKADDGHNPVKVTPPSGALVSSFVEDLLLVSEGGMGRLDVCRRFVRGVGWDGKESSNHPG